MRHCAVVVIVAGLGAGLLSCTPSAPTLADCGGGACHVLVPVNACVPAPKPDPLTVQKENDIFWDLDDAAKPLYQFRDNDGVILKTADSDFYAPQAQMQNKKFKLHDKNSKAQPGQQLRYPYTIHIQQLVSGNWVDCPAYDPTIINQG